MKLRHILLMLAPLAAQSGSDAIIVNLDTANWTHEKNDGPGSEGVMLRADKVTGGIDLLVRYPAGHVIAAHSHDSNERIYVAEGQLTLQRDSGDAAINAGGFAFLPAHEVQRLRCSSSTRCTFYLSWDGKPESHKLK